MKRPALRGAELALQDLARDLQDAASNFADNTQAPFTGNDLQPIIDAIAEWKVALGHYREVVADGGAT